MTPELSLPVPTAVGGVKVEPVGSALQVYIPHSGMANAPLPRLFLRNSFFTGESADLYLGFGDTTFLSSVTVAVSGSAVQLVAIDPEVEYASGRAAALAAGQAITPGMNLWTMANQPGLGGGAGSATVTFTITAGGSSWTESRTLTVFPALQVDVDADNTTLGDYPNMAEGDQGPAERAAAMDPDDALFPGMKVSVGYDDHDQNGVPDYGDGIDLFGNGHANAVEKFNLMLIDIQNLENFPSAEFIFRYSASDPSLLTKGGVSPQVVYGLPEGKDLRVWTKDGPSIRNLSGLQQGGDFIQSDQAYTAQQLGATAGAVLKLYVEAVGGEDRPSSDLIAVEFYPYGSEGVKYGKTIKIRPYHIITGFNLKSN